MTKKIGLTEFPEAYPSLYFGLAKLGDAVQAMSQGDVEQLTHALKGASGIVTEKNGRPSFSVNAMRKYAGHFMRAALWASEYFDMNSFPSRGQLEEEGRRILDTNQSVKDELLKIHGIRSDREISGDGCDEVWSVALASLALSQRMKQTKSGLATLSEASPSEPEWYAAWIIIMFQNIARISELPIEGATVRETILNYGKQRSPELVRDFALAQAGYEIGFLYRDQWWRFNHEEAALRAYQHAEDQRKRGSLGAAATSDKAARRKQRFFKLALANMPRWIAKSERHQLSTLKRIALKDDEESGDGLFCHGNRPLSDAWFADALSELRASGELGRALGE